MLARAEFTAPFCPLHKQNSPCLFCLYPEVIDLITDTRDDVLDEGYIQFQEVDLNVN